MLEPRLNDKLNKHDKVFHQLVYDVLTDPIFNYRKNERTVVPTVGGFGNQARYDLSDGTIPLSQTKPIGYKSQLFPEVLGFLKGETNLKWYLERGTKIWSANAFEFHRRNRLDAEHEWNQFPKDSPEFREAVKEYEQLVLSGKEPEAGNMGNFYSHQWTGFEGLKNTSSGKEIVQVNQIENLIEELTERPTNRYAIVTAWNPVDVKFKQAALAPCHLLFQAYRYEDIEGVDRVGVTMYQRSADTYAGVNFNNAQYATLTSIIANEVGAQPGFFVHDFGDIHFYVGQGERKEWYQDRKNLQWLQQELKDPSVSAEETLHNLLKKLPSEGDNPGYDHMPYMLKQLSRDSNAPSPTLRIGKPLAQLDIPDMKVAGYKFKTPERPEVILINGYKDEMAS